MAHITYLVDNRVGGWLAADEDGRQPLEHGGYLLDLERGRVAVANAEIDGDVDAGVPEDSLDAALHPSALRVRQRIETKADELHVVFQESCRALGAVIGSGQLVVVKMVVFL